MKAVVLARGAGTRMRDAVGGALLTTAQQEAAAAGQKGMMPIGSTARPFLDYVLASLADAGCREVCLVVPPEHEVIRRYYESDAPPARVRVTFAVQHAPDGTANALLAAEAFAGADPFLVVNSDNLYPVDALHALVELGGPGLPAFERQALVNDSGFPAERVATFALLEVDEADRLRRIAEKPGEAQMDSAGPRALISMNVWRFDRRVFDACRDVPRSARGEFELPEAVALAMARGVVFRVVRVRGAVLDLSRRADIPEVTRRLSGVEPHP